MIAEDFVTTLCIWREAQDQPPEAWQAVVSVIDNRFKAQRPYWGRSRYEIVTKPWQFSSMAAKGDPNLHKWPRLDDPFFQAIYHIVSATQWDNTHGAVFYHDISISGPPKVWGPVVRTVQYGRLIFYKEGTHEVLSDERRG